MQKGSPLRVLLFIVFSCLGIAAITLSMLAQEWVDLYTIKSKAHHIEQTNLKIKALNRDHQTLIAQIQSDPNILKRLEAVVLGAAPDDTNSPTPAVTAQQLQKAKAVLAEDDSQQLDITPPAWLARCSSSRSRIILFIAGAGLILVSFTCFAKTKKE